MTEIFQIATLQHKISQLGYRWREEYFNDKHGEHVYVEITKDLDPLSLLGKSAEAGWGRTDRLNAWAKALDWVTANPNPKL